MQEGLVVPDKTNPIWRAIVVHSEEYTFNALATKLMMMRIKMIVENDNEDHEKNIQQAIEIAYEYFVKNQTIVGSDINYLLNLKGGTTL